MSDASEYLQCPNCGNPFQKPAITQSFNFPDDYVHIARLIEGRLNIATCPLCKVTVTILDLVVVFDEKKKAALICFPSDSALIAEQLQGLPLHDFSITVVDDYDKLRDAIVIWINVEFSPRLLEVLSDRFDAYSREEQIKKCSPAFLRVFKSLCDGFLPFVIHTQEKTTEEESTAFLSGRFILTVSEQIQRLGKEVARKNTLLDLANIIQSHIPKECITSKVLEITIALCPSFESIASHLFENGTDFGIGFRQEYLNAVVHNYVRLCT